MDTQTLVFVLIIGFFNSSNIVVSNVFRAVSCQRMNWNQALPAYPDHMLRRLGNELRHSIERFVDEHDHAIPVSQTFVMFSVIWTHRVRAHDLAAQHPTH